MQKSGAPDTDIPARLEASYESWQLARKRKFYAEMSAFLCFFGSIFTYSLRVLWDGWGVLDGWTANFAYLALNAVILGLLVRAHRRERQARRTAAACESEAEQAGYEIVNRPEAPWGGLAW